MTRKHAVLINNAYVDNFAVRYLGAHLKDRGFRVSIIHCEGRKDDVFNLLPEESLRCLADYCRRSDLVGLSLMTTHQLERCIQINDYLKPRIPAPIIWGGVPVMCAPRFYLQHADYICAGEGESVMVDLLEGKAPADIAGLGYKAPSGPIRINPIPDLIDLNRQPVPYMELDRAFLLEDGRLLSLREHVDRLRSSYIALTIRGCPYSCSYCSNSLLKQVFHRKGPYVRFIETDRVIQELVWARSHIPHLKSVILDDDDFFLWSVPEMASFLEAYRQKVNLPIYYLQTNVRSVSEAKLKLFRATGVRLVYLKIGLQSGSARVNRDVFNRRFDKAFFMAKLELLADYDVSVILDVISGNPYETVSDKYESLLFYRDMIRRIRPRTAIRRPIKIYDHKLMYYPGTRLYRQAMRDGRIPGDYIDRELRRRDTLRKHAEDFDNDTLVIALFNIAIRSGSFACPARLAIRLLAYKPVFRLFVQLDLVRKSRELLKIPAVDWLRRKLQREGLW